MNSSTILVFIFTLIFFILFIIFLVLYLKNKNICNKEYCQEKYSLSPNETSLGLVFIPPTNEPFKDKYIFIGGRNSFGYLSGENYNTILTNNKTKKWNYTLGVDDNTTSNKGARLWCENNEIEFTLIHTGSYPFPLSGVYFVDLQGVDNELFHWDGFNFYLGDTTYYTSDGQKIDYIFGVSDYVLVLTYIILDDNVIFGIAVASKFTVGRMGESILSMMQITE